MADSSNNKQAPAPDDAVAVSSKKQKYVAPKDSNHNNKSSLVARCRAVVVANMERYPAEIFGMLGEDDWDDILKSKHQKTAPQKGTGGLDGTGRRTPALSAKFLTEVEAMNEHLADSKLADELVWKDCVEYQFSRAGLTRPKGLLLPWPVLVQQLADQAELLMDLKKKEDQAELEDEALQISQEEEKTITDATKTLQDSPMNLTLLKESGIGKSLKKLIKASKSRSEMSIFERIQMPLTGPKAAAVAAGKSNDRSVLCQLEKQLQAWMDLAASKGVDMHGSAAGGGKVVEGFLKDAADLRAAENCSTWRQLFATLKDRGEQRRANLGQKMRDNRKRENKVRPKILKVVTLSRKKQAILDRTSASSATWSRGGGTVASHGGAKVLALRKEAAKMHEKQKAGLPTFKKQSGFGQAVAFAATSKLSAAQKAAQSKRKAAALVSLGAGKRMAVPAREMRMQGTKFSTKKQKRSDGRR